MTPTFFAAAVADAEDAFVTKDLNGIIQTWNEGAQRLFGFTADEAIGQPISILIPMDRLPEEREILRRIRKGERVEQYQTVRLTKSGGRIVVSVAISPIRDANGNIVGASKVARPALSSRLPADPRTANAILDRLPLAVYICDPNGAITGYNQRAVELWGRAPTINEEYYCGSHRLFRTDGTPMGHDECPMAQAVRSGANPGQHEIIVERPDGRRLFAQVEPIVMHDEAGNVVQVINTLQDITERKHDDAVRAHLAAIIEGSRDAIISKNMSGVIQTWNPAAEAIFGYTAAEAIGHPITMLIPYDRQQEEAEVLTRVTRGERVDYYETERLRKDGRRITVSITVSPIHNSNGEVIGASKIARDSTETKANRAANEHLAAIVESSNDAIISMDLNGIVQSWNLSAENLFGYGADEVIGRHFTMLMPEDRRSDERRILDRIEHGERVSHYETARLAKNGKRLDISLTVSPIRDPDGKVIGASKTARDISERKRAERAIARLNRDLRQRVDELQTLFGVAPIGIAVAEDPECTAISINAAGARMLRVAPTQNISLSATGGHRLPFRVFSKGRQLAQDERPMWQAAHHNRDVRAMEVDFVHNDGSVVNTLMYASPLHYEDGTTRGAIGVILDITERRRAEREVLKSQHLESIGVLAGGIAHDFNNILTALFGNISLARLAVADNEAALLSLTHAERAFMRARDLTQQLLTFSRGGAPIRKTVALAEFLRETVSFLLHGSQIDPTLNIEPGLWPVDVDLGQINQAVNNLVINAKEAMADKGTLRLTARNTTLQAGNAHSLRPGRYVEIAVSDTGSGIPEQHLARIFDPYFTTKGTGTGLGLATTYSIIRRHDGDITVSSRIDEGSTFTIYLPASEQTCIEESSAPTTAASGTGRVLVMDDEPAVRNVAQALLVRLGYEPVLAEDGERAVALCREAMANNERFDVAILDLTVPSGMGGLECLKRLREIDPGISALVSSGYSNDPIMANYADYGFAGILSKPYRLGDLSEALANALKRRAVGT